MASDRVPEAVLSRIWNEGWHSRELRTTAGRRVAVVYRGVWTHSNGPDFRDAILEMLARFSEDLASLQRAIRWGEGDKLFELFARTRAVRRSIIEAGQEVDAPDFGRQIAAHPEKS